MPRLLCTPPCPRPALSVLPGVQGQREGRHSRPFGFVWLLWADNPLGDCGDLVRAGARGPTGHSHGVHWGPHTFLSLFSARGEQNFLPASSLYTYYLHKKEGGVTPKKAKKKRKRGLPSDSVGRLGLAVPMPLRCWRQRGRRSLAAKMKTELRGLLGGMGSEDADGLRS